MKSDWNTHRSSVWAVSPTASSRYVNNSGMQFID